MIIYLLSLPLRHNLVCFQHLQTILPWFFFTNAHTLVYDTSSKWKNQIKSYMALNSRQVYPKVLQRHLIHIPPEDGDRESRWRLPTEYGPSGFQLTSPQLTAHFKPPVISNHSCHNIYLFFLTGTGPGWEGRLNLSVCSQRYSRQKRGAQRLQWSVINSLS